MSGLGGLIGIGKRRTSAAGPPLDKYRFDTMDELGSWGFLPGIAISRDGSVRLIRGDGSNACSRWDPILNKWVRYLTASSIAGAGFAVGDLAGGVKSLAIAPTNPQRVYFQWAGYICRSDNAIRSFYPVLGDGNLRMNANDDARSWGPMIAVDPKNEDFVVSGSQMDGLKISRDGGTNWYNVPADQVPLGTVITPLPSGDIKRATETVNRVGFFSAGVSGVLFDPNSPRINVGGVACTSGIYVSVYGYGLYYSTDAGQTWGRCPSTRTTPAGVVTQLTVIQNMRRLSNGVILCTVHPTPTEQSTAAVWRYSGGLNGTWTRTVMPTEGYFKSIAEDPLTPGRVAAMIPGGGAKLMISTDYALTFTQPTKRNADSTGDILGLASVLGSNGFITVGELRWDPVQKGRLWLSEGTGVWYTDVPDAAPSVNDTIVWHSQARGIAQLVTNCIAAPQVAGDEVVVGHWDRSIMKWPGPGGGYTSLPMPDTTFGSCWGLSTSPFGQYIAASVGNHQFESARTEDPYRSGRSTDGGNSFTKWPQSAFPTTVSSTRHPFAYGQLAVSEPGNVVWCPAERGRPHYTLDDGTSWQPVVLPGFQSARPAPTDKDPGATADDYGNVNGNGVYVLHNNITADQVVRKKFYLLVQGNDPVTSGLFISTDGGINWTRGASNPTGIGTSFGFNMVMVAAPGNAGHLWLTEGDVKTLGGPFFRSVDGGLSWTQVGTITDVDCFAFGKAAPSGTYPTIFAVGIVGGLYGIHRSTDQGATWRYLTTFPASKIQGISCIAGDMTRFGRVYIVTSSGYAYGEPSWLNLG